MSRRLSFRDGGVKSRKLWFSVATSVFIFAGAMLSTEYEGFTVIYGELVGGLLGSLGLYMGANVGAKHVVLKGLTSPATEPPAEPIA